MIRLTALLPILLISSTALGVDFRSFPEGYLELAANEGPYGLVDYAVPQQALFEQQQSNYGGGFDALQRRIEEQRESIQRELALATDPEHQQDLNGKFEEELRIPGERPRTNDSYLCTAFPQTDERYVVEFEPLSAHNAHHIIMFACNVPGVNDPPPYFTWDCGEMAAQSAGGAPSQFIRAPPCQSDSAPIYAWSHGAGDKKTELPEGAGFPMGGRSKNQWIVLQVHYMNALEDKDFSGVKIRYTYERQPKTAATLLLVTGGELASGTRDDFEAACTVDEPVTIHPIAFRVHTHRHGEKVSGWLVRKDENGNDDWTLLGERDPQKPQIFEPIKNASLVINQGDVLASRCTIYNNENHALVMGPTSEDEMCNFYLIYYSEGPTLRENICYSPGAPIYHWKQSAGLDHIPN